MKNMITTLFSFTCVNTQAIEPALGNVSDQPTFNKIQYMFRPKYVNTSTTPPPYHHSHPQVELKPPCMSIPYIFLNEVNTIKPFGN